MRNSVILVVVAISVIILLLGIVKFYDFLESRFPFLNPTEIINGYVILGTFISGLAFIGFLAALFLQREDLKTQQEILSQTINESKDQNRTIALQRFENTFFKLLESLAHGLEHIQYRQSHSGTLYNGREAFIHFYESQNGLWRQCYNKLSKAAVTNDHYLKSDDYKQRSAEVYNEFKHQVERSFFNYNEPHFNTILTCVGRIDANKQLLGGGSREYINILSAQLTIYEKWALLIYLDIKPHTKTNGLLEIGLLAELTDVNFTDSNVFQDFKSLHSL